MLAGVAYSNFHICKNLRLITENVALGKPVEVGSVYLSNWYLADLLPLAGCTAANGNRDHVFDIKNSNCFRSERFDYRPFWQVDFGRAYTITNITIYASSMRKDLHVLIYFNLT